MERRTAKAAGFLLACLYLLSATASSAQQQQRPRTLLDLFFGQRPVYVEPPPPKRTKIPRVKKTPTGRSVTTITTAPAKAPAPSKLEDARKILVVGDFFADAMADGLTEAFLEAPGVAVIGKSSGSSGLVRQDYHNWEAELPALIDSEKPAMLVVQVGANDRQQLVTADAKLDFRTPEWFAEYEKRVTALTRIATERKVPLLWVGLPAFRSATMTADAISLNGIYRSAVTKAGGEFIDIWEGFVDLEGRFIVTGSDVNGQQVRLRGADGIGLSPSGKRKMAFYVEKPARRILGDMTSPDLLRLDGSNLPELVSLPPSEIQNLVRTRPIDLSDPELDGSAELLDRNMLSASPIPTPRDLLVEKGELPPAPFGRIDDVRALRTGSTTPPEN